MQHASSSSTSTHTHYYKYDPHHHLLCMYSDSLSNTISLLLPHLYMTSSIEFPNHYHLWAYVSDFRIWKIMSRITQKFNSDAVLSVMNLFFGLGWREALKSSYLLPLLLIIMFVQFSKESVWCDLAVYMFHASKSISVPNSSCPMKVMLPSHALLYRWKCVVRGRWWHTGKRRSKKSCIVKLNLKLNLY